jgi:hypothetical protein
MYLNEQREIAIVISPLAFKMPHFGSVVKRNSRSGFRAQVRTTRRIVKNRFLPMQRKVGRQGDDSLFSYGRVVVAAKTWGCG